MSAGPCCTERVVHVNWTIYTERVIICTLDGVVLRADICQLESVAMKELIYVSWTYMSAGQSCTNRAVIC